MPDAMVSGISQKIIKEASLDMSLVTEERGEVIKLFRTFWGQWRLLILHKGEYIEKPLSSVVLA